MQEISIGLERNLLCLDMYSMFPNMRQILAEFPPDWIVFKITVIISHLVLMSADGDFEINTVAHQIPIDS